MNVAVQTDDLRLLEEAVNSKCEGVRFGSEFCMYNIPNLEMLETAYEMVEDKEKRFSYVTPRLSNSILDQTREHLSLLSEKDNVQVIVNDLGMLNILRNYPRLRPHLGRQMIRVPAQSPWTDRIIRGGLQEKGRILDQGRAEMYGKGDLSVKEWYRNAFSYTGLNPSLATVLARTYGVSGADVNWIPCTFQGLSSLIGQDFRLSAHVQLVPIAITRKCHTARFMGEEDPETCSKPCSKKVFILKNDLMDLEVYLRGNVVFTSSLPRQEELHELRKAGVCELVLTMNAITGVNDRRQIDEFIDFASGDRQHDRFGLRRVFGGLRRS